MGGSLSLIAEFPDREPVTISCIASVEEPPQHGLVTNSALA